MLCYILNSSSGRLNFNYHEKEAMKVAFGFLSFHGN